MDDVDASFSEGPHQIRFPLKEGKPRSRIPIFIHHPRVRTMPQQQLHLLPAQGPHRKVQWRSPIVVLTIEDRLPSLYSDTYLNVYIKPTLGSTKLQLDNTRSHGGYHWAARIMQPTYNYSSTQIVAGVRKPLQ